MARPKKNAKVLLRKCDVCGVQFDQKAGAQKDGGMYFCSPRCRSKYARESEAMRSWLLMRALEQAYALFEKKKITFKPKVDIKEYPGVDDFRPEWNKFGLWIEQEISGHREA